MGATGVNFLEPEWNNPLAESLDAMRDNCNYLLCLAVAGSHVAPGWTSSITGGAEPSAITLSKGTRTITVNVTWE